MGTWAAGVYENDSALDWVGSLLAGIADEVRDDILEFDESNGDCLLAAVDTIRAVCENSGGVPPKLDEVNRWQANYLRCWQSYIKELGAEPEHIAAQEDVIQNTFDRLATLSNTFWNRSKR